MHFGKLPCCGMDFSANIGQSHFLSAGLINFRPRGD
jgi:hypothetical protein